MLGSLVFAALARGSAKVASLEDTNIGLSLSVPRLDK